MARGARLDDQRGGAVRQGPAEEFGVAGKLAVGVDRVGAVIMAGAEIAAREFGAERHRRAMFTGMDLKRGVFQRHHRAAADALVARQFERGEAERMMDAAGEAGDHHVILGGGGGEQAKFGRIDFGARQAIARGLGGEPGECPLGRAVLANRIVAGADAILAQYHPPEAVGTRRQAADIGPHTVVADGRPGQELAPGRQIRVH